MIARARRSEAGATLVEILVAVVVIGVGFVAILGGLGTSFALSALHREQARTETELRRYAEVLKAASYVNSCAATAYATVTFTPGADYSVAAPEVVDYVSESTGASVSCTTTTPVLQVVRLTVTSTKDTRAEETIDVVKRPS